MNDKIDPMIGMVFGRLTVEERVPKESPQQHNIKYRVRCICGNIKDVWKSSLVSGATRSCGCLSREMSREARKKSVDDLTGQKFYRLFVLEFAGNNDTKMKRPIWKCLCDCGNIVYVESSNLKTGHTKSCGCLSAESSRSRSTTHGMAHKHRLYNIWNNMRQRCNNPKSTSYERYGAIGISVCKEWDESFSCFYEWAKEKYEDGLTIDRIDPYGNYEPSNCRWSTYTNQARNKRGTLSLTINGETRPIAEWCDVFEIDYSIVNCRRQRGWDVRDLFNKVGEKRRYPINKANKTCFTLNLS